MADAFTFYCDVAGRWPLLTASQEIQLGREVQAWMRHPDYPDVPKRVEQRGRRARDKMLRSNLRLVVSLARNLQRRLITGTYDFADLLQDGNMGLLRAIEKYDPERGYRFSTYACWWIRQSMRRGMEAKQRVIRPPAGVANALERYNRVLREEAVRLGRMPTQVEMMQALGLSEAEYHGFLRLRQQPFSLDASLTNGNEKVRLGDAVADPSTTDEDQRDELMQMEFWREALKKGWGTLTYKERSMLVAHYGLDGKEPQTLHALAKQFGGTREACRQQMNRAKVRLRFFGSGAATVA